MVRPGYGISNGVRYCERRRAGPETPMHKFDLYVPTTLEEAHRRLTEHDGARVLAGGTALILLIKEKLVRPRALVSLVRVRGLADVGERDGHVALGGTATIRDVSRAGLVRERFPFLADALGMVGNLRVRSMATVGGSLCEADYQSDMSPVLLALGATVVLAGPGGARRRLPVGDFLTGLYETALEPGEVVVEVDVPRLPEGAGTAYCKFVTGPITDRPCVGIAAVVMTDTAGHCTGVRVSVGGGLGMTSRPLLVDGLDRLAAGQPVTEDLVAAIAEEAYRQADPMSDLRASAWYRKEMVRVFSRRALVQAAARARRGGRA
jgi:carbon-monoxide dehydrogenase medium subunit